jgi:hypothetical protein
VHPEAWTANSRQHGIIGNRRESTGLPWETAHFLRHATTGGGGSRHMCKFSFSYQWTVTAQPIWYHFYLQDLHHG